MDGASQSWAEDTAATREERERNPAGPLAGSLGGGLRGTLHVAHQQAFRLVGPARRAGVLAGRAKAEALVKTHGITVGVGDPRVDFLGTRTG
jgi:hypothetical protein